MNSRMCLLVVVAGCGAAQSPPPRTSPVLQPSAAKELPPPPPVESAPEVGRDEFLLQLSDGSVGVRSVADKKPRILVPHAQSVLYDPALELLWYIEANRLEVLDLREPEPRPVLIARDMKDMDVLTVTRGAHSVTMSDGCEGPYTVLRWSAKPSFELYLSDSQDKIRVDGSQWLQAQLERPARTLERPAWFSGQEKVALAADLQACDMEDLCGSTLPFGREGWQLTLVAESSDGGDCGPERACLLRDPRTNQFATPPGPGPWSAAEHAMRGSCGPYLFDESQSAFLLDDQLCHTNGACETLDARAIGWLKPGDTISAD